MFSVNSQLNKNYNWAIIGLCACYFIFQLFYIPFPFFGVDEFWFAHHIYQYTHSLPYRDFPPYKPVLGYYLLSLPYYFSHGLFTPLYMIKYEIAIINTLLIGGAAAWATRWFQRPAIFLTLLIIICSQFFLVYSSELRVDMLSSWLCLIAALFFLNRQIFVAGIFMGLAFLVSQKAIWYFIGMNCGIAASVLAYMHYRTLIKKLAIFNGGIILTIAAYVLFWSTLSSLGSVLHSMFYEAYTQTKISVYATGCFDYWRFLFGAGPLLIMLCPLAFLGFFSRSFTAEQKQQYVFIVVYAVIAVSAMMYYNQFFPYNTVFLLPAYFLFYAQIFSWLLLELRHNHLSSSTHMSVRVNLNQSQLFYFFSGYMLCMIVFVLVWQLEEIYLFTLCIPIWCWFFLAGNNNMPRALGVLLVSIAILVTGVFYPLMDLVRITKRVDGAYQKSVLKVASELIANGEYYLAGILLFYDKDQVVPGTKNLITPALMYMYFHDPVLVPSLVASLNISPATQTGVIQDLKNYPVKIYVDNYRINGLPPAIKAYLNSEYQHYWGTIYIYAPTVNAGKQKFSLKFNAKYRLESANSTPIVIDNHRVTRQAVIYLQKGKHLSQATSAYRLKLVPDNIDIPLNPKFEKSCLNCFMYGITL